MTTIEFHKELKRIHDHAEDADRMAADFIVVVICNLSILIAAYISVEVLL